MLCLVDDEGFIELAGFVSENAGMNLDAGGPQHADAPAVYFGVGILDCANTREIPASMRALAHGGVRP